MASQETVDRAIIAVVVVIGLLGLVMHYGGYSSASITGQPIAQLSKIRTAAIEPRQATITGPAATAQRQQMTLGTKTATASKKSKYPIIKPAAGQRLSAKTARAGDIRRVEPERCDRQDNDGDGQIDEGNVCVSTCRDSDNSANAIVSGYVTGIRNSEAYAYYDRCIYERTLEEYYCGPATAPFSGAEPKVVYPTCMGGTRCQSLPNGTGAICGY